MTGRLRAKLSVRRTHQQRLHRQPQRPRLRPGTVLAPLAVARAHQGLAGRPVTLAPQGFGQANPLAPNTTDADLARKPVARYGEAWSLTSSAGRSAQGRSPGERRCGSLYWWGDYPELPHPCPRLA